MIRRRLGLPALVLAAVGAAACAGGAPAAKPKRRPVHPECVRPRDHAKALRFRAADGVRIVGVEFGKGSKAVVLAHQIRSNLCEWVPFARLLAARGFRALAIDLRGYGLSGNGGRLTPAADVAAAARVERARGARTVLLMGASMGGTAALAAARTITPAPAGVVALSSPAQFGDMDATAAVAAAQVPLLLLAARDDDPEIVAAQQAIYDASAATDKQVEILPGYEHGSRILRGTSRVRARQLVLGFLAGHRAGARLVDARLPGTLAYGANGDIWIARPDGSGRRRLVGGRGPQDDPTWAPDGSRLAYRDSRRGYNVNDEIYVVGRDGSNPVNITHSSENEWGPAWSPDGNLIAFSSDTVLYVMRPDGSDRRQITDIEAEYPAWSPDGTKLAFMSIRLPTSQTNPDYEVYVVGLDGTGLKRMTFWRGENGLPAWSPDGRQIAFQSRHDDRGQFGRDAYYDVYVMNADGSGKRRLVKRMTASYPVWSPDGRWIVFTGGRRRLDQNGLWAVHPDGSGLRRLPLKGWLADWTAR